MFKNAFILLFASHYLGTRAYMESECWRKGWDQQAYHSHEVTIINFKTFGTQYWKWEKLIIFYRTQTPQIQSQITKYFNNSFISYTIV